MTTSQGLVILIGPPGVGKTTVGKALATLMGVPFRDTDAEIVKRHGAIPDIFASEGEASFRAYEADAVRDALAASHGVVSLGGGAPLTKAVKQRLLALDDRDRVIFLDVSPQTMTNRLSTKNRPLLAGGIQAWRELYEQREAVYREVATHTVDTSHLSMKATADTIFRTLVKEQA